MNAALKVVPVVLVSLILFPVVAEASERCESSLSGDRAARSDRPDRARISERFLTEPPRAERSHESAASESALTSSSPAGSAGDASREPASGAASPFPSVGTQNESTPPLRLSTAAAAKISEATLIAESPPPGPGASIADRSAFSNERALQLETMELEARGQRLGYYRASVESASKLGGPYVYGGAVPKELENQTTMMSEVIDAIPGQGAGVAVLRGVSLAQRAWNHKPVTASDEAKAASDAAKLQEANRQVHALSQARQAEVARASAASPTPTAPRYSDRELGPTRR